MCLIRLHVNVARLAANRFDENLVDQADGRLAQVAAAVYFVGLPALFADLDSDFGPPLVEGHFRNAGVDLGRGLAIRALYETADRGLGRDVNGHVEIAEEADIVDGGDVRGVADGDAQAIVVDTQRHQHVPVAKVHRHEPRDLFGNRDVVQRDRGDPVLFAQEGRENFVV